MIRSPWPTEETSWNGISQQRLQRLLFACALLLGSCFSHRLPAVEEVPLPPRPDREVDEAESRYVQGMQLLERSQPDAAVRQLTEAARLKPDHVAIRCALSTALLQAKKPGHAWHTLDHLAQQLPQDPRIAEQRVLIWQALGATGIFNVGADPDRITDLLGKPSRIQSQDQHTRWIYDFMAVSLKANRVHSIIDMRDLRQDIPLTTARLAVNLNGRTWRAGHRFISATQMTVDYLPPGESLQQWTELLTVQTLFELAEPRDLDLSQLMEEWKRPIEQANREVTWRVLHRGNDRIVFAWTAPPREDREGHYETTLLLKGKRDVHRLTYSRRDTPLEAADESDWVKRFAAAQVVPRN